MYLRFGEQGKCPFKKIASLKVTCVSAGVYNMTKVEIKLIIFLPQQQKIRNSTSYLYCNDLINLVVSYIFFYHKLGVFIRLD